MVPGQLAAGRTIDDVADRGEVVHGSLVCVPNRQHDSQSSGESGSPGCLRACFTSPFMA